MSFREKSAWFVLVGLLATFGVFFFFLGHGVIPVGMSEVHHFLLAAVAFIVIQIVLHIIAAILDRKGAGAPKDEREQLIALKAARNAGLALTVSVFAVPVSAHMISNHGGDLHAHYAIFIIMGALVFSE